MGVAKRHMPIGSGVGQMTAAMTKIIEDRVTDILDEKLRVDDAEEREKEDENRQLKA